MQHLKVSGAVRPLKWSLGVKWLRDLIAIRQLCYSSSGTWWYKVTHGKGSEGETGEWSG